MSEAISNGGIEVRSPKSEIRSGEGDFRCPLRLRTSDFGLRTFPALFSILLPALASAATNTIPSAPGIPDVTVSLLRIFGALLLVLAVFFGGVWMFRNWQRNAGHAGRPAKLQILEMRSIGNRNAVFVVGYEQQRMLVASSPAGVVLLDHLPNAAAAETEALAAPVSFAEALRKYLPIK